MQRTYTFLMIMVALLLGTSAAANAVTAYGPIATGSGALLKSVGTYYFCNSSAGVHNAEDACVGSSCGGCAQWFHRTMLSGSYFYQLMCNGNNACAENSWNDCGGAGTYFQVNGSNGYAFRQLHLWRDSTYTKSKWANAGTPLGELGGSGAATAPHSHSDNLKSGTKLTAWMSGKTCGNPATTTDIVGNPQLQ